MYIYFKIKTEIMKYYLDFASTVGMENIPRLEFDNELDLVDYFEDISGILPTHIKEVYLLTGSDCKSEIIISDNFDFIKNNLYSIMHSNTEIALQVYESFESAYSVALMMREGHELCYSEKT